MIDFLNKLFGNLTEEDHRKMESYLRKRIMDEYKEKKNFEEKFLQVRRIAMDLASKLNDRQKMREIDILWTMI